MSEKISIFVWRRNVFFSKKYLIFIHHIGTLSKKLLALKKFFWQGCQNFTSLVLGNILEKLIALERIKFFYHFRSEKFFLLGLTKLHSEFLMEQIDEKYFSRKNCFLNQFVILRKMLSIFRSWINGKDVRTAFYVSIGIIWWKISVLWPNFLKFF